MNRNGRTTLALTALALTMPFFSALAQTSDPNDGIEDQVRAAFADAPDMIAVAKCESGFRQFAAPDVVLRGGSGGGYVGIFQIGESLHSSTAASLGYDILTIQGNIGYAKYLFGKSGIAPWRECAPAVPAPPPATTGTLTANLVFGVRQAQVRTLQQILNAKGFVIAASGPGSAGNETEFFGSLTREAVRRFQCDKKIVCEGNESTTGYGRVGPRTRAALLQ